MATSYINDMQQNKIEEISWNKLHQANLAMQVPFLLPLGDQDYPARCERIVRLIPKKRMVVFGTWNEQPIVVKLFYDSRSAKRHYQQELAGVEALLSAGIPTPRLLYHGVAHKKRVYIMVFEEITDAQNLDALWQKKENPEELTSIMYAVTVELATQHVLGIIQRDLHFKNFLIKGEQVYTLDGGSIESLNELLPKKPSLDHLALFFSQLGVGSEQLQQALFQIYAKSRGWIVKRADVVFLHKAIKKWNDQRRINYQEKIERNCTAFARINKAMSVAMYDRTYSSTTLKMFLTNPDDVFTHPAAQVLKAGRSSTVIKVKIDGRYVVIKRYNMKNIFHWLRRTLRPTRAARSWKLANTLRLFGIETPKPIAYVEKRFLGLRNKSYFMMEYIDGMSLNHYFARYQKDDPLFEQVALRVVSLLKNLVKLKMSHGDLKANNILIHQNQPMILDLDGMKEYKQQRMANRSYKSEIKRFMKNWENMPSVKALFEKLI